MIFNGIDLSDLILIFLSVKIRTFMTGSVEAKTVGDWKKQKDIKLIKQNLFEDFIIFSITLFEKQILKLP